MYHWYIKSNQNQPYSSETASSFPQENSPMDKLPFLALIINIRFDPKMVFFWKWYPWFPWILPFNYSHQCNNQCSFKASIGPQEWLFRSCIGKESLTVQVKFCFLKFDLTHTFAQCKTKQLTIHMWFFNSWPWNVKGEKADNHEHHCHRFPYSLYYICINHKCNIN